MILLSLPVCTKVLKLRPPRGVCEARLHQSHRPCAIGAILDCDGIAPMTQGLLACWRWASQSSLGGLNMGPEPCFSFLHILYVTRGGKISKKGQNWSMEFLKNNHMVNITITNSDLNRPCFAWRPYGKSGLFKTELVIVWIKVHDVISDCL